MKKLAILAISALSIVAFGCHRAQNQSQPNSKESGKASALDAATAANEKVEKVAAITDIGETKGTRIFVVGDSTLSSFNDPYFYPRYGYGTQIQSFLKDDEATVVNLAMSGRSSKSFLKESNYKTLSDNIKAGDYLIIGFGHNDEKLEDARYTNPNGTKEEKGSFKNSLYENYVKLAKDKKATPILCTPIVRRAPGKAYEGSVVHVTADSQGFSGGDYPKAIRELGAETGTLVIDLTEITKKRYESLDDAATAKFHAQVSHKEASTDNTHLNKYGAAVVAFDVVSEIAKSDKTFAKLVKDGISAPTLDILKQNPDYIMPKYTGFNPQEDASKIRATTAPWFGTVFGDCGGEEKLANPEFYEIVENGTTVTMHSGSTDGATSVGKIAGSSDGIQFYFQQIPADKDFTLSATAKILHIANNNQASFGLMVRDDVYIDKFDNAINTDYVAAGPLKIAKGEDYSSSWQRVNTNLNETKNQGQAIPQKEQTVEISLTKKGNVYTAKYGSDTAQYTANLTSVDEKNIYAGLFTVRSAYVEFSNVNLTIE